MAATSDSVLFSWQHVEQFPQLKKLQLVLDVLPYQGFVAELARRRGRGRNDYPVDAMFRLLVAGIVLQHPSAADLLRNLHSNPLLANVCGFNPLPFQQRSKRTMEKTSDGQWHFEQVDYPPRLSLPDEWAFSRFMRAGLDLLKEHDYIEDMFNELRVQLRELLPDYGVHLGADGKKIESHSTGRRMKRTGKPSDEDADWGKYEKKGVDKKGNAWEKITRWFGYKLHAITDTVHELPVAYEVTVASRGEQPQLRAMLEKLRRQDSKIAARCEQFSADQGYDGDAVYEMIDRTLDARPIIDNRNLWRQEKQDGSYDPEQPILRLLNDGAAVDNILYSERGTVYCQCPSEGALREMSFFGYEKDRGTLKYRCPARVNEFDCQGFEACLAHAGSEAVHYGRVVRISLEQQNRRIFTRTPRHTRSWQKAYDLRSSVERLFSRVADGYLLDHHYIRGLTRMKARIGLSMVIMLAMAIVRLRSGQPELIRSLVEPLPLFDSG